MVLGASETSDGNFTDPVFLACIVKNENFDEANSYLSHYTPIASQSFARFFGEFRGINDMYSLNWFIDSLKSSNQEIVRDNLFCFASIECVVKHLEFVYNARNNVPLVENSIQKAVSALILGSNHTRATTLVKCLFAFSEKTDSFFTSLLKSLLGWNQGRLKLYQFLEHLHNNTGHFYKKVVGRLVQGMNWEFDSTSIKACETLIKDLVGFSDISSVYYACVIKASSPEVRDILIKHLWIELVEEHFTEPESLKSKICDRHCCGMKCEQTKEEFVASFKPLAAIRAEWFRKRAVSIVVGLEEHDIFPLVINQIIAEYLVPLVPLE